MLQKIAAECMIILTKRTDFGVDQEEFRNRGLVSSIGSGRRG